VFVRRPRKTPQSYWSCRGRRSEWAKRLTIHRRGMTTFLLGIVKEKQIHDPNPLAQAFDDKLSYRMSRPHRVAMFGIGCLYGTNDRIMDVY
jgi:hypothetical protein